MAPRETPNTPKGALGPWQVRRRPTIASPVEIQVISRIDFDHGIAYDSLNFYKMSVGKQCETKAENASLSMTFSSTTQDC